MNCLKYCLTLIIFSFSIFCNAQKVDSVGISKVSSNIKLSYNSSFIYPGASIGIELPLKTKALSKTSKSGILKNFTKDYFLITNLSWYHQPAFHDNLYLTAGWMKRKTKTNGFFTEISPEIGLSRTFLAGTSYKVDDNGNVSIKKYNGSFYVLACIGGGIGYDFSKIKQKPFMVFYKFNVLMMFPYNSTIYMRPAMEAGFIYKPLHFISSKFKNKV